MSKLISVHHNVQSLPRLKWFLYSFVIDGFINKWLASNNVTNCATINYSFSLRQLGSLCSGITVLLRLIIVVPSSCLPLSPSRSVALSSCFYFCLSLQHVWIKYRIYDCIKLFSWHEISLLKGLQTDKYFTLCQYLSSLCLACAGVSVVCVSSPFLFVSFFLLQLLVLLIFPVVAPTPLYQIW